jgi:HSP20 family protein
MQPERGGSIGDLMRGVLGLSADEEAGYWSPPTDVYETDENVVVAVEIAGARPDALSVLFDQGVLTIRGERDELMCSVRRNYHKMEMRFGPFLRRVRIPCAVSAGEARAAYEQGVLTVVLPKAVAPEQGTVHVRVG